MQTSPSQIADQVFNNPQKYRNNLLNSNILKGNIQDYPGKTFVCVSLTRFCPVGCKFCFFKSGPTFKTPTIEDKLIEEGVDKFIEFCNDINLGYLLVSGGGEPMIEKKSLLQLIRRVNSERIVLVTSANWAKTPKAADAYLSAIKDQLEQRESDTSVTVRVSVDSEHVVSIGLEPILNLIELFYTKYKNVPQMDLQIHSLAGDPIIDDVVLKLEEKFTVTREYVNSERISDGKSVVKIVPKQEKLTVNDMTINVGYAKAFYSDLKVDLTGKQDIQKNLDAYQRDLYESEDGNSATVTNKLGVVGLDFWVNYNGNVTTWGNQYLDNLYNLYTDSADDLIQATLSDPAALSFVEKGADYRDRVVSEANPRAVKRSKAVNIRDYTGALMFDEARTRLYYTIRSLQDYIQEGRIKQETLQNNLDKEMIELLSLDRETLVEAYKNSRYTIVQQTIEKGFDKDRIKDILAWCKLGHYDIDQTQVSHLLDFYNKNVHAEETITSFDDIQHNLHMQVVRMTEHLTHIKPGVISCEETLKIAS